MLHVVESRKPIDQLARDLEAAVTRHQFGVLGTHDLEAAMVKKGVTFARECRIFEVCGPHPDRALREPGAPRRGGGSGADAGPDHGRGGEIGSS